MATEIEIAPQPPGEEPGLSFADVLRWLPLLQAVIPLLIAGEGSFVTKTPWGRRRVTIEQEA